MRNTLFILSPDHTDSIWACMYKVNDTAIIMRSRMEELYPYLNKVPAYKLLGFLYLNESVDDLESLLDFVDAADAVSQGNDYKIPFHIITGDKNPMIQSEIKAGIEEETNSEELAISMLLVNTVTDYVIRNRGIGYLYSYHYTIFDQPKKIEPTVNCRTQLTLDTSIPAHVIDLNSKLTVQTMDTYFTKYKHKENYIRLRAFMYTVDKSYWDDIDPDLEEPEEAVWLEVSKESVRKWYRRYLNEKT